MKIWNTNKRKSITSLAAGVVVLALVFACFTTACQPVAANAAARKAAAKRKRKRISYWFLRKILYPSAAMVILISGEIQLKKQYGR